MFPQRSIIQAYAIRFKQNSFHSRGTFGKFANQNICTNKHIGYLALDVSLIHIAVV